MNAARASVGLILLAMAGSTFAEWKENAHVQNIKFYFESNSVRHSGGIVSVTELYDHQSPQRLPQYGSYSSQKLVKEYDCDASMHRVQSLTTYGGNMMLGPASQNNAVQPWVPVKPNTYSALMLKSLCKAQVVSDA